MRWMLSLGLGSVVLSACGDTTCPPQGPDRYDVVDAPLDEQVLSLVRMGNRCGGEILLTDVSVSGDPAFTLNEGASAIPGEGEVPVSVAFVAPDYDLHIAELTASSEGGDLTIVLTGQADPDQDGDGVDAFEAGGEDCDDTDPDVVGPVAEEVNGRDDDCDGLVDEDAFQAGDVVITELMLTPAAASAPAGQWIEIRNLGRLRVDLRGWTLSGPSGTYTIGEGLVLSEGERGLVGFEADPALNGGITLDAVLTGNDAPLPTQGWFLALGVDNKVINVLSDKKWPEEAGHAISLDPIVSDPAEATRAASWCAASSALDSGDFGTPGQGNDLCPQFDHDGDGLSVLEGDCDDTNSDVSPIAADVWDGLDNDCDGITDLMVGPLAATGVLQGPSGARLGADITVADWDGDGQAEAMVVASSQNTEAWLFPASELLDPVFSPAGDRAAGVVHEPGGSGALGAITGIAPPYDVDGDGDDDLVVLGRPANFYRDTTSFDYLWVHDSLPDSVDPAVLNDDAILVVEDPKDGNSSDGVAALFDVDLDGDGSMDTTFGHGSYKGGIEDFYRINKGRVWVLDLQGQSGSVHPQDVAVRSWIGETEYTGAGDAIAGGDVNGDGYDDIIVMDTDPFAEQETDRRVQVLTGGAEPPASGTFEATASMTLTGLASRPGFGSVDVEAPLLADVDDDGSNDLVVPDPYAEQVLIWHDASSLGSAVEATSADLVISGGGNFGADMDVGEIDGVKLLIGAPASSSAGEGRAWLFDSATLAGSGTVDTTGAEAVFGDSSYAFGSIVKLYDLDADGVDEVIVPEDFMYSGAGGVLTFQAP